MLRSLKALEDYRVSATDGKIGKVIDFYFDDEQWKVRYLVVDTSGFWEPSHEVLISPNAFTRADWQTERIALNLTQEKVKNSPPVDLAKPVSRQYEEEYFKYYNWPNYWEFSNFAAPLAGVNVAAVAPNPSATGSARPSRTDPHLRSTREVTGYAIHGTDGDIGHVRDFIIEDDSWAMRYLVVDTSHWWFGKSVLVAPRWIDRIDWPSQHVSVTLPRDIIKNSPEWKPDEPVNREYEVRLYDYYGRPAYWLEDDTDTHGKPEEK